MRNFILYTVLTGAFLFSCEKKEGSTDAVPQSVIDLSLEYFSGEVIEKSQANEEGINAWKVKIRDDNGSVVSFYWKKDQVSLLKLEGENEPFDYEIQPGNQLLHFSTARTVAIASIKNSSLIKWKLAQEETFIGDWVYTFEFDANEIRKVYLNAKTGDVLQVD